MPDAPPIVIHLDLAGTTPDGVKADVIVNAFKARLEKRLTKKARAVQWVQGTAPVTLAITLNAGNRLLRYLIPFASPATVDVRGQLNSFPGKPEFLAGKGAAHFGLLGGSAEGMLKVAAELAADRMAKRLLTLPPASFQPAVA